MTVLVTMSCSAPRAPSPDSRSFQEQRALAEFAGEIDRRLLSSPGYAGFYTEDGRAIFLFVRDADAQLKRVTSDPRAASGTADFSLGDLKGTRDAVEADFARTRVPFNIISTDHRRNRVIVDGIDREAWDRAVARGDIEKRRGALYFFKS